MFDYEIFIHEPIDGRTFFAMEEAALKKAKKEFERILPPEYDGWDFYIIQGSVKKANSGFNQDHVLYVVAMVPQEF